MPAPITITLKPAASGPASSLADQVGLPISGGTPSSWRSIGT